MIDALASKIRGARIANGFKYDAPESTVTAVVVLAFSALKTFIRTAALLPEFPNENRFSRRRSRCATLGSS